LTCKPIIEVLRLDVSLELVLPRLPALLFVSGFVANASWDDKTPVAIPVVSLDMHVILSDTSLETDMMTSVRSKMIKTEGTMMAMTMVPLFTLAGDASSSVLFAIIIRFVRYSCAEKGGAIRG
jgi:hypothetical protein